MWHFNKPYKSWKLKNKVQNWMILRIYFSTLQSVFFSFVRDNLLWNLLVRHFLFGYVWELCSPLEQDKTYQSHYHRKMETKTVSNTIFSVSGDYHISFNIREKVVGGTYRNVNENYGLVLKMTWVLLPKNILQCRIVVYWFYLLIYLFCIIKVGIIQRNWSK